MKNIKQNEEQREDRDDEKTINNNKQNHEYTTQTHIISYKDRERQ